MFTVLRYSFAAIMSVQRMNLAGTGCSFRRQRPVPRLIINMLICPSLNLAYPMFPGKCSATVFGAAGNDRGMIVSVAVTLA